MFWDNVAWLYDILPTASTESEPGAVRRGRGADLSG